jgi:putative effector of murein hydrolase LrgA (UPF0299 family)
MEFFENKFFLLAITFGFFFFSKLLQKKTGWVVLNPILLAIALLICFLKFTGVSYETYNEAGSLVEFWLKPAVVALGVPLYLQLRMIKKQLMPILVSQLVGCIVGLVSVTIIAKLMGASPAVIMSLAPKSVTTPIAMEVSKAAGGIPSLTAVWSDLRFQDSAGRTRRKSDCTRPFHGNCQPCGGNITGHGSEWKVWSLCQSGTDVERYSDRFADSDHSAFTGIILNKVYI